MAFCLLGPYKKSSLYSPVYDKSLKKRSGWTLEALTELSNFLLLYDN